MPGVSGNVERRSAAFPRRGGEVSRSARCVLRPDMRHVLQHQLADSLRPLVRREMPDAGKHLEAVGRRDKIHRAFGGDRRPCRRRRPRCRAWARGSARAGRGSRRGRDTRPVPPPSPLYCRARKVPRDGISWNAVRTQSLAQPFGIVGQNAIGRIGFEKPSVMPRTLRLFAVVSSSARFERVRMRPRQHGERSYPFGKRSASDQRCCRPSHGRRDGSAFAIACGLNDRHRIVHQPVDVIIGVSLTSGRASAE